MCGRKQIRVIFVPRHLQELQDAKEEDADEARVTFFLYTTDDFKNFYQLDDDADLRGHVVLSSKLKRDKYNSSSAHY